MDSDDFWKSNLLERCVNSANGVDVVWFNCLLVHEIEVKHIGSRILDKTSFLDNDNLITYKDLIDDAIKDENKILTFAWKVFIDFEFLLKNDLKFINQCTLEDNLFGAMILYSADRIQTISEKIYYYRIRENSETNYTAQNKVLNIPHFMQNVLERFHNDRVLTRRIYICLSCYIMNLHLNDFVEKNKGRYGIEYFKSSLNEHFRKIVMQFLTLKHSFDTNEYMNLCFNMLLHLNKHYRDSYPFEKLDLALNISDLELRKLDFIKDFTYYLDSLIVQQNAQIKALQEKVKQLEEENSELYLQNLQKNQSTLRIFR